MSKEQNYSHETSGENLQKDFIRKTIESRYPASFLSNAFKEIIADVAIDIKQAQTIDTVLEKAGNYDTLMGYEDQRYEQIIHREYRNMKSSDKNTDGDIIMNLKKQIAFDTSKAKLIKQNEQERWKKSTELILKSAKLCTDLIPVKQKFRVSPDPKYL
jgi:hypothetical protein